MSQADGQTTTLVNPLAARLRAGEIGLALMIKHARTVDIALAAKTCGFDVLSARAPKAAGEGAHAPQYSLCLLRTDQYARVF